jgi:hypothetical protein
MAVIESPRTGVADTLADRPPAGRPHAARPCALEGLTLDTLEEAEGLAAFVGLRLQDLGRRVNLIVNYDNFELRRGAAPRFIEMVREHERRYLLSSLSQTIYRSFEEGTHALGEHSARRRPVHPGAPPDAFAEEQWEALHRHAPAEEPGAPALPRKQLRSAAQRVPLTAGDRPTRP